ncbi:MAG: copper resistance protein B [Vicinamibacterales bacterium]
MTGARAVLALLLIATPPFLVPRVATAQGVASPPVHQHDTPAREAPPVPVQSDPHAGHHPPGDGPADAALPPFVPRLTDADRRAAFPEVHAHAAHDNQVNYFVLFDQLEWQPHDAGARFAWDDRGWIGRDLDRVWFRTEGLAVDGGVDDAEAHLLYGRAIARWWDVVAGVRQDVRPGRAQTWGAVGIQGLAPYWFDLSATAYVGAGGRTALRLEADYELLLTNRLILKPLVELDLYGRADPERRIGAGLSSMDAGVRVRYEFRREFAPYVGITWRRTFGGTARFARENGEDVRSTGMVAGVRLWF